MFDNAQVALWGRGAVADGKRRRSYHELSAAECDAIAATCKEVSEVVSGCADYSVDQFISAITTALRKGRQA